MKTRLFITALCTLLIGGAIYLKVFNPRVGSPALQAFVKSELFHIPAHLLLYGALALACRSIVGRRPWIVLLAILTVGVTQEAAQSILFGRAPGVGEVFDLCVDGAVTLLVLLVASVWPSAELRHVRE